MNALGRHEIQLFSRMMDLVELPQFGDCMHYVVHEPAHKIVSHKQGERERKAKTNGSAIVDAA